MKKIERNKSRIWEGKIPGMQLEQKYRVAFRCSDCGHGGTKIMSESESGKILVCEKCGSTRGNCLQTEIEDHESEKL